jgi:hypothetical protein
LADDYDDDLVLRMDWSVDASEGTDTTTITTEDSAGDDDSSEHS